MRVNWTKFLKILIFFFHNYRNILYDTGDLYNSNCNFLISILRKVDHYMGKKSNPCHTPIPVYQIEKSSIQN